jgi:hypothetical protein
VIVPYAPGSATDLIPRTVFEAVSAHLGRTTVVDNRAGGGTTVGTNAVAAAEPDGHTILVHSNALVTVPAVQAGAHYDPVRDFSGVTPLGNVPLVLIVPPEKKITSVQQLVAIAKAKPGSINYAAAGIGTPPHFTAERFRIAAGFEGQLVPFKVRRKPRPKCSPAGSTSTSPDPGGAAQDRRWPGAGARGRQRQAGLPRSRTCRPRSRRAFRILTSTSVGAMVPKRTPRDIVARLHQRSPRRSGRRRCRRNSPSSASSPC